MIRLPHTSCRMPRPKAGSELSVKRGNRFVNGVVHVEQFFEVHQANDVGHDALGHRPARRDHPVASILNGQLGERTETHACDMIQIFTVQHQLGPPTFDVAYETIE